MSIGDSNMKNFAVINDTNIVNVIVCESKALAEEITGLTCVEFTSESAEVGGTYVDGSFIPVKPYPSWIFIDNAWTSPVSLPDVGDTPPFKSYSWNEETTSWDEIASPE